MYETIIRMVDNEDAKNCIEYFLEHATEHGIHFSFVEVIDRYNVLAEKVKAYRELLSSIPKKSGRKKSIIRFMSKKPQQPTEQEKLLKEKAEECRRYWCETIGTIQITLPIWVIHGLTCEFPWSFEYFERFASNPASNYSARVDECLGFVIIEKVDNNKPLSLSNSRRLLGEKYALRRNEIEEYLEGKRDVQDRIEWFKMQERNRMSWLIDQLKELGLGHLTYLIDGTGNSIAQRKKVNAITIPPPPEIVEPLKEEPTEIPLTKSQSPAFFRTVESSDDASEESDLPESTTSENDGFIYSDSDVVILEGSYHSSGPG